MNPLSTKPIRWRPSTVFNLLVGLLFCLAALGQPAFLKDGLVAYYPFSESGNEIGSPELDLSKSNLQFVDGNSGVPKDGVSFDGKSALSTASSIGFLNIFGAQQESSVSIWIKPDGKINNQCIVTKGYISDNVSLGNKYFIISYLNGGVSVNLYNYNKNNYLFIPPSIIAAGKWQHIVVVRSINWRIYLDGKDITNLCQSGLINQGWLTDYNLVLNGTPLTVGAYNFRTSESQFNYQNYYTGSIAKLRFYSRELLELEVKALYDYESTPQPLNPLIATATAQVVNGFIVGATITDTGYGYVENPTVTITGGGGTGAKATATQFNGVVTSITITNPGIGYTSAPTITIAPPPFPPRKATSTAQIVNGFVVGTKITDGGFGYDTAPAVLVVGGGGSGATAVATVANGVVTAITITNPGTGYTSAPLVRIASPPFAPKLGIETSKIFVRMSVVLGRKYQLEASTDLNNWTITGPAFIAQDEELAQEFDVNQVGRYFRINQVP